jgi:hypothetical protein
MSNQTTRSDADQGKRLGGDQVMTLRPDRTLLVSKIIRRVLQLIQDDLVSSTLNVGLALPL